MFTVTWQVTGTHSQTRSVLQYGTCSVTLQETQTFLVLVLGHEHSQAQQSCSAPYFIEQAFPTGGPEQTRWKLCWQVQNGPNLVITGAWFRPDPQAAWIKFKPVAVMGEFRLKVINKADGLMLEVFNGTGRSHRVT